MAEPARALAANDAQASEDMEDEDLRSYWSPSRVTEFLYLGGYHHTRRLQVLDELHITHILNVRESGRYPPVRFKYYHYPVSDFGTDDLKKALKDCRYFIDDAKARSGRVLIHCSQGINRAPTIAIGYLMLSGQTLRSAYKAVANARPQISPHESYFQQLQDLDAELYGSVSLSRDDVGPSLQSILRDLAHPTTEKTETVSASSLTLEQLAVRDSAAPPPTLRLRTRETDAETTDATLASDASFSVSDDTAQLSELATSASEISYISFPRSIVEHARTGPATVTVRAHKKGKCIIS